MLFKPHHIPQIRSGSKTVTRRDWDENYPGPKEGSVVAAVTELFTTDEEADCFIRITNRYEQALGAMTTSDARREGDYNSLQEFRHAWAEINGEWDPDLVVDVLEFEYVGMRRPTEQQTLQEVA